MTTNYLEKLTNAELKALILKNQADAHENPELVNYCLGTIRLINAEIKRRIFKRVSA